jgi:hypothetical protein
LETASPSLTKRYEPVFTRLAVVKGSLRLASYQHVPPPSWPHLYSRSCDRQWSGFGFLLGYIVMVGVASFLEKFSMKQLNRIK